MKAFLLRILITLAFTIPVFLCCELYVRSQVKSVEDRERSAAGLHLDRDPSFLYEYTTEGRRMLPNRNVIIHNHFTSGLDVAVQTNSLGFRDDELPPTPLENEIRILVLGDSITVAEYLDRSSIFTDLAEQQLRKVFPDRAINLINAGVSNIGLREELDILEERGLQTKPQIVLLNFYLNDSRPSWGFHEEAEHRGWIRRHSLFINSIYQQLKLWGWKKNQGVDRFKWIPLKDEINWKESPAAFKELVEAAAYDWGAAWRDESWSEISLELDRLDALAAEHSFKVLLAALPVSFQVYSDELHKEPQDRLSALIKVHGYPYLDLLPVLRRHKDEELFFDHCHPNQRGHQVIAEAMAGFLADNLK